MAAPVHSSQWSLNDFLKSSLIMSFPCLLKACQCHSTALKITSKLLTRTYKVICDLASLKSLSMAFSTQTTHFILSSNHWTDTLCRSLNSLCFISVLRFNFFFLLTKNCIFLPLFRELTAPHLSKFSLDGTSCKPSHSHQEPPALPEHIVIS